MKDKEAETLFEQVTQRILKRTQEDLGLKTLIKRSEKTEKQFMKIQQEIGRRQVEIARDEWVKALKELSK
ncbi:MAG: hypothetical protein ACE5L6_02190 [Candidatus Bathyarchaeia archaeon]